jgi:predicted DNA-binding transcriptional regulator
MALNFDPTKMVKPPTSSVKIFEEPETNHSTKTELTTPIQHQLNTNKTPINNGVDSVFKKDFIGVQSVSEEKAIGVESVFKSDVGVELVLKKGIKQGLDTINSTPKKHHLDTIVGKEREFLFFIAKQCQKNGSLITQPLTIEKIKMVLSYSNDGIKTVVYRLTNKGLIARDRNKKGRAGWVCYSLTKEIYDQILSQEDFEIGVEMVLKKALKQGLNQSYSSNNLYSITNTTEVEIPEFQIPENVRSLGIGQKSLQALVRDNFLSFDEIQESLNSFSYDILKNTIKNKTAGLFFGILRKKTPYISSEYIQNQEREIKEQVFRYEQLIAQRKKLEELKIFQNFKNYIQENPDFMKSVKLEQKFEVSDSILESIAFAKFCDRENTDV